MKIKDDTHVSFEPFSQEYQEIFKDYNKKMERIEKRKDKVMEELYTKIGEKRHDSTSKTV